MNLEAKKILVAEDDDSIRDVISDILELEGCTVFECKNGLDALESLKHFKPDLVISDIMMPVMDGFSLLEEYQKIEESSPVPFIFLTAMCDSVDLRKGMNLGADDFLTKPFSNDDLLKSISTQYTKFQKRCEKVISEYNISFEEQTSAAREEKVVLLKEIHHRVKHNFALLSAFMELEDSTDKEKYIESIKSKVFTIASVHEEAYSNEMFTSVDIKKLINKIVEKIYLKNDIIINNKIDYFELDIAKAIPFGILFSELFNFVLTKFFSSYDSGEIAIICGPKVKGFVLRLELEGLRKEDVISSYTNDNKEFEIINILVSQLGGVMDVSSKSSSSLIYTIQI